MPDNQEPILQPLYNAVARIVDGPVTWWRESVVEPNQQKYNWYHRRYRRVPTVDQCYTDDPVCQFEAQVQFVRDKKVDSEILNILRTRAENCVVYHGGVDADAKEQCMYLWEIFDVASGNFFCKYGDLGAYGTAKDAYMKQKHRLIWERRYGPVGSGMNRQQE